MSESAGRKVYGKEVGQTARHAIRLQAILKRYQTNDIYEP
jgi:hypothetical protein